jgi:hypothetical protein
MAERLLWLGAGSQDELDERLFCEFVAQLMARLVAMRVRSVAMVLPGRAQARLDPARAMDWFLEASQAHAADIDEVLVLDSHDAHRAMQPLVDRARRRALADF